MDNDNRSTIIKGIFPNGISVYLITILITFVLNKILNIAWLNYAPIVIAGCYIIWALVSIYNSKVSPIFELNKIELLFYQIIFPLGGAIIIGIICMSGSNKAGGSVGENVKKWILDKENLWLLVTVFSILVLLCYFAAFKSVKMIENTKTEC